MTQAISALLKISQMHAHLNTYDVPAYRGAPIDWARFGWHTPDAARSQRASP